MINSVNHQFLTNTERRAIFERARLTQPFFNSLTFPIVTEAIKRPQYEQKLDVNKDFWFTEVQGNFGQIFEETDSLFDVSLYSTLQSSSFWRYIQSTALPSGMVMTDARFNQPIANHIFTDIQNEYMPRKILAGDRIIGKLVNLSDKTADAIARIVLKGYYTDKNEYLNFESQRGITETLNKDIRFEEWRFTVNHDNGTKKTYTLANDRYARLVLGFAAIDKGAIANNSESLITISDNFKELKWSNEAIPLEFYAPRSPIVRDCKFYYLPIEYFFEPFATLKFEIQNDLNGGNGYDFIMLTRTI